MLDEKSFAMFDRRSCNDRGGCSASPSEVVDDSPSSAVSALISGELDFAHSRIYVGLSPLNIGALQSVSTGVRLSTV